MDPMRSDWRNIGNMNTDLDNLFSKPFQAVMSMELLQAPRMMNHLMRESLRDLDRIKRGFAPYWKDVDHSVLHVANETQKMVNDDKKFAVSLDVSQFHPEELIVHVEGRELTIEGSQEHKSENGCMKR
ncbi:Heat shock protein beta-1 [Parelaphostrongylus tenuis]|uniref:Heat shock protein beta-1 n=1 Tax=Parelaphostrongylus tenuis TaxID=148309 RepID=A0AAD5QNB2_PARTN|nr:Heat shock protein beta-1 [Parelaphostrongylus tenuis]